MTDRAYRIPMSGVTGRMGYRLAQALSMKCGIGTAARHRATRSAPQRQ
ncbi:hypothetical protein [Saccharopolyspora sp. ASAGF58]|nr:hypothetical protein [Saccharopolyspora sp. ASAGF58]